MNEKKNLKNRHIRFGRQASERYAGFVWAGGDDFSRDYPQPGQDIIVTGRFETYFENDWEYMRLADAELIWSKE